MPRRPRICPAGTCFHGLNRAVARLTLFENADEYGSLGRRIRGERASPILLSEWPVPRPRRWRSLVNRPQTAAEIEALRRCVRKGTPFGSDAFVTQSAVRLQLQYTLRSRGRPRTVRK